MNYQKNKINMKKNWSEKQKNKEIPVEIIQKAQH